MRYTKIIAIVLLIAACGVPSWVCLAQKAKLGDYAKHQKLQEAREAKLAEVLDGASDKAYIRYWTLTRKGLETCDLKSGLTGETIEVDNASFLDLHDIHEGSKVYFRMRDDAGANAKFFLSRGNPRGIDSLDNGFCENSVVEVVDL